MSQRLVLRLRVLLSRVTSGRMGGRVAIGSLRLFERRTRRIGLDEATAIQTFPVCHPWQGSRIERSIQIGNAVPPLFAEAVLRTVAREDDKMVVDLFAGPGGWDVAARRLGFDPLGIEWDPSACATREAAGMPTLRADVSQLDPWNFPCDGLIASPPCQAFSAAGKGLGKQDKPHIIACAHELAAGHDTRAEHLAECQDARSLLTVEPLRWALTIRPKWIAFEQVPAVLELWTLFAGLLEACGYSCATGLLNAEQYGVPQTRKRAFFVASRDSRASLPEATHEKYRKGKPRGEDVTLLPWVSMAEALGWESDEPVLRSNYNDGGTGERGERGAGEPAFTVTGSFRPDVIAGPGFRKAGDGSRQNAPGSVRVTAKEAATLQTFPTGFPWQGAKTKQFQQIGNAVPPLLAEYVLRAATNA